MLVGSVEKAARNGHAGRTAAQSRRRNAMVSSGDDTAISSFLPQNLLGALNVAGEHVRALTTVLGTELVEGAAVVAGVGLNVTIYAGVFVCVGRVYAMPETPRALTDNATNYVYWDRITRTYGHSTNAHPFQSGTRVPLAKVVTAAGAITGVTDLRKPLAWLNERSEILVGPVDALGVHFNSVGAAVRYVGENLAPSLGTATRNYRIRVVGHVVEPQVPIVIPANGIVIEGLAGDSTAPAAPGKSVIEWTGDPTSLDAGRATSDRRAPLRPERQGLPRVPRLRGRLQRHDARGQRR